jgi:hypothetical protein
MFFSFVKVEKDLFGVIDTGNTQNNLIKKCILGKSVFGQFKSAPNPLLMLNF